MYSDGSDDEESLISDDEEELPLSMEMEEEEEEEEEEETGGGSSSTSTVDPFPGHSIISGQSLRTLLDQYPCGDCGKRGMTVTGFRAVGLSHTYTMTCECNVTTSVPLCPETICYGSNGKQYDHICKVNYMAVAATTKSAKGFEHLKFLTSSIDLGRFSRNQWDQCFNVLSMVDSELCKEAIIANREEELRLTKENSPALQDIEVNGKVCKPAVLAFDGNWCTRGFHSNQGFAVMVGRKHRNHLHYQGHQQAKDHYYLSRAYPRLQ